VVAVSFADADADLVITTGGVGHGDRDFVLKAWENLGVKVHFRRIDLSPGRHSALGSRGRQLFCALPGNPWAAQVVFSEIIAPMLRRWQASSIPEPPVLQARLATAVHNRSGLHRAIRGVLENRDGTLLFLPERSKGSSLFAQVQASPAYALVPPKPQEVPEGSGVQATWFHWPLLAIAQWVDLTTSRKALLSPL
jgi:molybdopterin biosynthesis enzyme